uniref:Ymf77 n=2 Tax=Tetrahymena rostrata TaxID=5909 RepID=A0A650DE44_TETRO|nr:Ymf77 [Tetrahymena rostrata]
MGSWNWILTNYRALKQKNKLNPENKELSMYILKLYTFYFFYSTFFFSFYWHLLASLITSFYITKFIWTVAYTWFFIDYICAYIIMKEEHYIKKKYYIIAASIMDIFFLLEETYTNYRKSKTTQKNTNERLNFYKFIKNLYISLKTTPTIIINMFYKIIKLFLKIYSYFNIIYVTIVNYLYSKNYFNKTSKNLLCINFFFTKEQRFDSYYKTELQSYNKLKAVFKADWDFLLDRESYHYFLNNLKKFNFLENLITFLTNLPTNLIKWLWYFFKKTTKHILFYIIYMFYFYRSFLYICFNFLNFNIYFFYKYIIVFVKPYLAKLNHYIIICSIHAHNIIQYIYIYTKAKKKTNVIRLHKSLWFKYRLFFISKYLYLKILDLYNNFLYIKNYNIYIYILKNIIYIYIIIYNSVLFFLKKIKILTIYIYNINIYNKYILIYIKNNLKSYRIVIFYLKLIIIRLLDSREYYMVLNKNFYKKDIKKLFKKNNIKKQIPDYFKLYLKKIIIIIKKQVKTQCIKLLNTLNLLYEIPKLTKLLLMSKNKIIQNNHILNLNIVFVNLFIKKSPQLLNLNKFLEKNQNILLILLKIHNIYIYNLKIVELTTIKNKNIIQLNFIKNIKINITNYFINKKINIKNAKYFICNFKKLKKKLNLSNLTIRQPLMISLAPSTLINTLLSDVCLSITVFIKKNKKITKIIKLLLIKKYKFFKKYYTKTLILKKNIQKILHLLIDILHKKTAYIFLVFSYFLNKEVSNYIFTFSLNKQLHPIIDIIFLNKNILYVLSTIIGILIILSWSKKTHSFYGKYLWTMTVFPFFLETHKILYTKLLALNCLNLNTIDFVIMLKAINYNINITIIYYCSTILILAWFIYYCKKHEAFRHTHANFKSPRWYYIKYILILFIIEILRLKIIKHIHVYILYINLKYNTDIIIFNLFLKIINTSIIQFLLNFTVLYIYEINYFQYYYILQLMNITNLYIINFVIDVLMAIVTLYTVVVYCRKFVKMDWKFVAFPMVTFETLLKYIAYTYILIYTFTYSYTGINDGKLLWYGPQLFFVWFIYLDWRVHKIPKKTMAWYFKFIVDLWPQTAFSIWCQPLQLYNDQQKYLAMRLKFKNYKQAYQNKYNKSELWNKKITLAYQKDKEDTLFLYTAFAKTMSRKENMLREFNIFDYYGWQYDWTHNYKKINIFHWNLNWWDKPYMYFFDKLIYISNVKFFYFNFFPSVFKFSTKLNYITFCHSYIKFMDHIYTHWIINREDELDAIDSLDNKTNNINPWDETILNHGIFYRGRKYKKICREWKRNIHNQNEKIKWLKNLKKFKKFWLENSCGKVLVPLDFLSEYKKIGWKIFENKEMEEIILDWRPNFEEW